MGEQCSVTGWSSEFKELTTHSVNEFIYQNLTRSHSSLSAATFLFNLENGNSGDHVTFHPTYHQSARRRDDGCFSNVNENVDDNVCTCTMLKANRSDQFPHSLLEAPCFGLLIVSAVMPTSTTPPAFRLMLWIISDVNTSHGNIFFSSKAKRHPHQSHESKTKPHPSLRE